MTVYDPFIGTLSSQLNWWQFALGYALLDIAFNLFVLYFFSGIWGEERVKEYFKDTLAKMWPWIVLAPIAAAYILVFRMAADVRSGMVSMGFSLSDLTIPAFSSVAVFASVVLFSLAYGVGARLRYLHYRPDLWFNHPRAFGWLRLGLFDFPLYFMAFLTIARLVEIWVVCWTFLGSSWVPISPYSSDELYGIEWLESVVIAISSIMLVLSFLPPISLIRERRTKYSRAYSAIFALGLSAAGIASLGILIRTHLFIGNLYEHFLGLTVSLIDYTGVTATDATSEILVQILNLGHLDQVRALPSGISIPGWLKTLTGARVLLLGYNLYRRLPAGKALPEIPETVRTYVQQFID